MARSIDSSASADAPMGVLALMAQIARSPIFMAAGTAAPVAWAPAGYDATDARILEWIASERRARPTPTRLAA